jgi:hypothetical protein
MLKQMLNKARKWKQLADMWLNWVGYTSVPVWKPWWGY